MIDVEHILLLAFKVYISSKVFSYQYVLRNLNFCHKQKGRHNFIRRELHRITRLLTHSIPASSKSELMFLTRVSRLWFMGQMLPTIQSLLAQIKFSNYIYKRSIAFSIENDVFVTSNR